MTARTTTALNSEFEVRLDPEDFSRLTRTVRDFDRELYSALRKRLRVAGGAGVRAVQEHVLSGTVKRDVGLRRALAKGTKVSISTSLTKGGIRIATTGRDLPPGKQAMVRAYNQASFRHPTFGHADAPGDWVPQKGRPYFGAVLYERAGQMRSAVEQALRDALGTVHGGTVS